MKSRTEPTNLRINMSTLKTEDLRINMSTLKTEDLRTKTTKEHLRPLLTTDIDEISTLYSTAEIIEAVIKTLKEEEKES